MLQKPNRGVGGWGGNHEQQLEKKNKGVKKYKQKVKDEKADEKGKGNDDLYSANRERKKEKKGGQGVGRERGRGEGGDR